MSSGDIGVGPAIAMFLLFVPIYFVLASLTRLRQQHHNRKELT